MFKLIGIAVFAVAVIPNGMLFQHIYSMTHIYPETSTKVMNARFNQAELISQKRNIFVTEAYFTSRLIKTNFQTHEGLS